MKFNEDTLNKLEEFIDNYLKEVKEKYKTNKAAMDKVEHIERTVLLTKRITSNDRMSIIAAKYHDIGRFAQLELLGSFNDSVLLHHNIGEDVITRAVFKGELDVSDELNAIRQVVQYHGRQNFIPYKPELAEGVNELIDIISRVDEIENGCIGATGYLLREAEEDSKGYKKDNPDLDMKKVSPEVWQFFVKGEKFDKIKYCKTYADYTLFASLLAIQALKGKDREIAKAAMDLKCNGYESALDGYRDIFSKLIQPEYNKEAFAILSSFYNKQYENPIEKDKNGQEIND